MTSSTEHLDSSALTWTWGSAATLDQKLLESNWIMKIPLLWEIPRTTSHWQPCLITWPHSPDQTWWDQWWTLGSNWNNHIPYSEMWDQDQERSECFPTCGWIWKYGRSHHHLTRGLQSWEAYLQTTADINLTNRETKRQRGERESFCAGLLWLFISWLLSFLMPLYILLFGVKTYLLSS